MPEFLRAAACCQPHAQGCVLHVQVSPNAKQSSVVGVQQNALKIRLAAKPVEGAANAELLRFLAQILKIPKSHLEILGGETSRHKRVLLHGLTPAEGQTLLTPPT